MQRLDLYYAKLSAHEFCIIKVQPFHKLNLLHYRKIMSIRAFQRNKLKLIFEYCSFLLKNHNHTNETMLQFDSLLGNAQDVKKNDNNNLYGSKDMVLIMYMVKKV